MSAFLALVSRKFPQFLSLLIHTRRAESFYLAPIFLPSGTPTRRERRRIRRGLVRRLSKVEAASLNPSILFFRPFLSSSPPTCPVTPDHHPLASPAHSCRFSFFSLLFFFTPFIVFDLFVADVLPDHRYGFSRSPLLTGYFFSFFVYFRSSFISRLPFIKRFLRLISFSGGRAPLY